MLVLNFLLGYMIYFGKQEKNRTKQTNKQKKQQQQQLSSLQQVI